MGPLTITLLHIYCWVCFERTCKINQHLAKLRTRKLIASSVLCARALWCWKTKNSPELWCVTTETVVTASRCDNSFTDHDVPSINKSQTSSIMYWRPLVTRRLMSSMNADHVRRHFVATSFFLVAAGRYRVDHWGLSLSPLWISFDQWTRWSSLHEYFSATVSNGWVLGGSLLHSVLQHSDFWALTFHKVMYNVVTHLRHSGMFFLLLYYEFTAKSVGGSILKKGEHLAKLEAKIYRHLLWTRCRTTYINLLENKGAEGRWHVALEKKRMIIIKRSMIIGINVKKLNSLKHRVRSQITRLKLPKIILRLRAWSIIMNIVGLLIIAIIKYA